MTTRCYLCNSDNSKDVSGTVRDRPEIGIRKCSDCGLVFLDSQDHISEHFYQAEYTEENHPGLDHESFLRESAEDDERRFQQLRSLLSGKRYLDVGCGGGGVLLRCKPICSNAAGVEPQLVWRKALLDKGITVYPDVDTVPDGEFDLISLFHVLEHHPDPRVFLRDIAGKAAKGAQLIIEVPNADDALLSLYQNAAFSEFTYWSAHLFLYTEKTLGRLLDQTGLKSWQIEQYQRYPLANHLRWLAKGEPGGHQSWSFLNSIELDRMYAEKLAESGRCDTLIAHVAIY